MAVFLIIIAFVAYWLPSIVAGARHKAHGGGVIVVNIFLGWTVIGWVVALAMALSGPTEQSAKPQPASVADELAKLAQLRDGGIITTKDYTKQYARLTK